MFSSLSQRLGARLIDRLDLLVELSTLGEYGVDRAGIFALEGEAAGAPTSEAVAPEPAAPPRVARTRDHCPRDLRVSRACPAAAARP
jgi:hypothetical protein